MFSSHLFTCGLCWDFGSTKSMEIHCSDPCCTPISTSVIWRNSFFNVHGWQLSGNNTKERRKTIPLALSIRMIDAAWRNYIRKGAAEAEQPLKSIQWISDKCIWLQPWWDLLATKEKPCDPAQLSPVWCEHWDSLRWVRWQETQNIPVSSSSC